jgi:prevent-host-death family protein
MEKTISALDARKRLGQLLEEVFYQGNQFIVERAGKPMAVVIPISQYQQWKERRERFFAMVDSARAQNEDLSPEEIAADVEGAVQAARQDKRAGVR